MGVPRTQHGLAHGLAHSRHTAFVEMMTLKLSRPMVLLQADPLSTNTVPSAACLHLRASPAAEEP